MKKKKICFTASSGGHSTEILRLKQLTEDYDYFYIMEEVPKKHEDGKIYYVKQVNRKELKSVLYFAYLFVLVWKILKKEKPDYIISTGAMSTFPVCLLGKLRGIKIIYLESLARVNSLSITGRIVYGFADVFIVQWKDLLKKYPKAVYCGGLF